MVLGPRGTGLVSYNGRSSGFKCHLAQYSSESRAWPVGIRSHLHSWHFRLHRKTTGPIIQWNQTQVGKWTEGHCPYRMDDMAGCSNHQLLLCAFPCPSLSSQCCGSLLEHLFSLEGQQVRKCPKVSLKHLAPEYCPRKCGSLCCFYYLCKDVITRHRILFN